MPLFTPMKSTILKSIVVILLLSMSSCTHVLVFKSSPGNSAHAPGQIKKMTGSKSAKAYAPGQMKKKN